MEHGGTKWTDLEQAVEQEFLSKIIPVSNLSLESSSLPSVAPPPSLPNEAQFRFSFESLFNC